MWLQILQCDFRSFSVTSDHSVLLQISSVCLEISSGNLGLIHSNTWFRLHWFRCTIIKVIYFLPNLRVFVSSYIIHVTFGVFLVHFLVKSFQSLEENQLLEGLLNANTEFFPLGQAEFYQDYTLMQRPFFAFEQKIIFLSWFGFFIVSFFIMFILDGNVIWILFNRPHFWLELHAWRKKIHDALFFIEIFSVPIGIKWCVKMIQFNWAKSGWVKTKKNITYGGHSISRPMQIVAPIPKGKSCY